MSEHIPIFCATDENYAPFASLMMKSVLMHTDSFIDFYIMDGGILPKTKKLILRDLKKYPNKRLYYIDMQSYDLSRFPNLAYYSLNTFSRYFIPQIAPDLKRIIYLDVDIIVKKDVRILFELDLGGHPIAAMPESDYFSKYSLNKLREQVMPTYKETSSYFNAGILVLDLPKLLSMDFTEKAVELTLNLYRKLNFPDQDVLNILFENNYKKMDYNFNFLVCNDSEFKGKYPENKLNDLIIIHYAGPKPWKEHTPFQLDFDDVLQTSVFHKRIIENYHAKKVAKFYLFGTIPLFKQVILKK